MEAILYPHHRFELNMENEPQQLRTAALASSLLFLDKVYLARFAFPTEDCFPKDDILKRLQELKSKHGPDVLKPTKFRHHAKDLTCEDVAAMRFVDYTARWVPFSKSIEPLTSAGVVEEISLREVIGAARQRAEQAGDRQAIPFLSPEAAMVGFKFTALLDEIPKLLEDPQFKAPFDQSYTLADGSDLAVAYLCEFMKQMDSDIPSRRGIENISQVLYQGYFLDVFAQSLLAKFLKVPLVTDDECHTAVRDQLKLFPKSEKKSELELMMQLFAGGLMATLPGILPRSYEAIIDLRDYFEQDLTAFRQRLRSLAKDLLGKKETPTPEELAEKVRKELAEPLESLERQLSRPSQRVLKNLFGSGSLISGGIMFLYHFLQPGGDVNAIQIGGLTAAMSTLWAYFRTKVEAQETVDNSNVAFLFKAKRLLEDRYRGIHIK